MEIRERLAEKMLASLAERELVQTILPPDPGEAEADRYVLKAAGLHLLAARDGVPPRRYVRYGVLAAPNGGKKSHRLETLVRQFEHTVGTNGFFVRLKRDLDESGGRLLRWLNASEATQSFRSHGKSHWLRPDGYAEVEVDSAIRRIFLEWDRGTIRRLEHLIEKFRNYDDYFSVREELDDGPALLIVTVSPHREATIWKTLRSAFNDSPPCNVLTSIDSLVERFGPLGRVWQRNAEIGRRAWV